MHRIIEGQTYNSLPVPTLLVQWVVNYFAKLSGKLQLCSIRTALFLCTLYFEDSFDFLFGRVRRQEAA